MALEARPAQSRLLGGLLWTRILALLGIVLLVERIATYYQWSQTPVDSRPFSAASSLGLHLPFETTLYQNKSTQNDVRKAIVVASIKKENTSWIEEHFPDWERNIYVADNVKADYTVMKNEGHEASVYLTYIIEHYWGLPDYMVFIHAKRYQWHNDDPMFDGVPPIKNLRLEAVDDRGYVSLRCNQAPGCPVGVRPQVEGQDTFFQWSHLLAKKLQDFFPEQPVPKVVAGPCCAQFAVSRAQVHLQPPQFYERLRDWIWHNHVHDQISGTIMEYIWHMVFGKPPVYCMDAPDCYCQNFGLCDLKCPKAPHRCEGRIIPKPLGPEDLPDQWPDQGQGKGWLPTDKWWEAFYPPSEYDGFTLKAQRPQV